MPVIRDPIFDRLRGMGILLVVLGHAIVGVASAIDETRLHRFLTLMIYSVHMPLFFILSAHFSERIPSLNLKAFLNRLWRRLLWPYVLWSVVLLATHFFMSGYTNTEVTQFQPWTILWKPPAVMWFLYVLAICQIVLWILKDQPRCVGMALGVVVLVLPYYVDAAYLNLRFVGLYMLATNLPMVLSDIWFSKSVRTGLAVILFGYICACYLQSQYVLQGYPAGSIFYLPMMIVGPVLLATLGRQKALIWLWKGFELLGRNSMAIYLMHILIVAGARIVLMQLGMTQTTWLILIAALLGVLVPLICSIIVRQIGINKVLGWA
ncbi:MAG: acyltransferase family protein [Cognatishimia sp.]|uniref:acyltransferase family protein n=1 Tax=Cognatishimia sp. TaxID=2211648 RepID=UPI003B8B2801